MPDMPSDRILLVDDEKEFTSVLAERLQSRGLRVDVADDGQSALALAAKTEYDVIILDLAMPVLDGIETLKRLRERKPDSQIILLTGQATIQKSIEAMKHGAVDLMEKPADIQGLLARIEQASQRKAVLMEKNIEVQLKKIMERRSW
jgi:DNA-binding response OmpR family regulator